MRMMNFSPMQMEHVLHMLKFELRVAFPTYAITWVRSSVAERLTADQQVPGSNPGVPSLLLLHLLVLKVHCIKSSSQRQASSNKLPTTTTQQQVPNSKLPT